MRFLNLTFVILAAASLACCHAVNQKPLAISETQKDALTTIRTRTTRTITVTKFVPAKPTSISISNGTTISVVETVAPANSMTTKTGKLHQGTQTGSRSSQSSCFFENQPVNPQISYTGVNLVNNRRHSNGTGIYKAVEEWNQTFSQITKLQANFDSVRLYSTIDVQSDSIFVQHLMNALPGAKANNLSVFVGIWAGFDDTRTEARFYEEYGGLARVLQIHGCDSLAAVSVGNEDLYDISKRNATEMSDAVKFVTKSGRTRTLIQQMGLVRGLLDRYGCCNVPVTHTDTADEWNTEKWPYVTELIDACDQFATVNNFPYWANISIRDAASSFKRVMNETYQFINARGKGLWLGETGWPREEAPLNQPKLPAIASKENQQQYWREVWCTIDRRGTGVYYYVSDDADAPKQFKPSFGIMDINGNALLDLKCDS